MINIMNEIPEIRDFFDEYNVFDDLGGGTLSEKLAAAMLGMGDPAYGGKDVDLARIYGASRTTVANIIDDKGWDPANILEASRRIAPRGIAEAAPASNPPIFMAVDDTFLVHTPPSPDAENPIQGCVRGYSNPANGIVHGRQACALILSVPPFVMAYGYGLSPAGGDGDGGVDRRTKIQIVADLISGAAAGLSAIFDELGIPPELRPSFNALGDRWYATAPIINQRLESEVAYFGAIKTNRLVHPEGWGPKESMPISEYAATYPLPSDWPLQTVGGAEHYVLTFAANVANVKDPVRIIATVEKADFNGGGFKNQSLRAFLSTVLDIAAEDAAVPIVEADKSNAKKKAGKAAADASATESGETSGSSGAGGAGKPSGAGGAGEASKPNEASKPSEANEPSETSESNEASETSKAGNSNEAGESARSRAKPADLAALMLFIYGLRWMIEVFFKNIKSIGWDGIQVRSMDSIERRMSLIFLLYNACSAGCRGAAGFSEGLEALRGASRIARAKKIIEIVRGGAGLEEVLKLVSQRFAEGAEGSAGFGVCACSARLEARELPSPIRPPGLQITNSEGNIRGWFRITCGKSMFDRPRFNLSGRVVSAIPPDDNGKIL